jgi:RNA polymerase sigma factor (sigma-70 family)
MSDKVDTRRDRLRGDADAWTSRAARPHEALGANVPQGMSARDQRTSRSPAAPSRRTLAPGGPPPFERVVELHGPALLRFCVAQVGPARGEDAFQETMLSAMRAYETVRDADSVRAWLFSIAARKTIDAHRARARAPEPVEDIATLAGTEEVALPDEALWTQVRALPDKQRQAVTLRYAGDLSHGEIAVVMETSEAAARRNVFEGLNRLRQDVER